MNGILFLACPGCLSVPVLNTFILTFSTCVSPRSIMSVFGPDGGWSSPHKIPFHCLGSGISRLPKGLAGKVQPEPCSLIWWSDKLAHGIWPTFGFDLRLLFFPLFLRMTLLSSTWHLSLHSCMALTGSKHSHCYPEKLF